MNIASKELCRELYGLSKIKTGRHFWSMKNPKLCRGDDFMEGMSFAAYSAGDLLRLLPRANQYGHVLLLTPLDTDRGQTWTAGFWFVDDYGLSQPRADADTLEDAACQLAIELFKQGVLKRQEASE